MSKKKSKKPVEVFWMCLKKVQKPPRSFLDVFKKCLKKVKKKPLEVFKNLLRLFGCLKRVWKKYKNLLRFFINW